MGQTNCEHRWLRSAVRWVISSAPSAQVICSVDAALWRRVSIPFHCSGDLYELWVSLRLSTYLLFPSATYPVISSGSGWNRNPLTQGSARNTSPCTCPRERLELLSLMVNLPAAAGSARRPPNQVSTALFLHDACIQETQGPCRDRPFPLSLRPMAVNGMSSFLPSLANLFTVEPRGQLKQVSARAGLRSTVLGRCGHRRSLP